MNYLFIYIFIWVNVSLPFTPDDMVIFNLYTDILEIAKKPPTFVKLTVDFSLYTIQLNNNAKTKSN